MVDGRDVVAVVDGFDVLVGLLVEVEASWSPEQAAIRKHAMTAARASLIMMKDGQTYEIVPDDRPRRRLR